MNLKKNHEIILIYIKLNEFYQISGNISTQVLLEVLLIQNIKCLIHTL